MINQWADDRANAQCDPDRRLGPDADGRVAYLCVPRLLFPSDQHIALKTVAGTMPPPRKMPLTNN